MNIKTIFEKCDFNDVSHQNYQEKIINNLPDGLNFTHFTSRSKLLIDVANSNYIIKIFLFNSSCIKNVQQLYKEAKIAKVEQFFAPYISQIYSERLFIQPKVLVAQSYKPLLNRQINNLQTIQQLLQETLLQAPYYKTVEYPIYYYQWLDFFFETYSYQIVKNFLQFIIDTCILDIFSPTNYGLLHNIPIVFDYDDCFRYDIKEKMPNFHQ